MTIQFDHVEVTCWGLGFDESLLVEDPPLQNVNFSGENPTALSVCSHKSATSNKWVTIKVTKVHSTAIAVDLGTTNNKETMVLFSRHKNSAISVRCFSETAYSYAKACMDFMYETNIYVTTSSFKMTHGTLLFQRCWRSFPGPAPQIWAGPGDKARRCLNMQSFK